LGDIVDFFLEPSQRFADPFTDLWELPRPENDEDNDEDNNEFRDPHGTEHGANPYPWQDAEKVRQLRSRIAQRLNVPKRTPRLFARCGLAERPF
jgi:hypothetical protein